MARTVITTATLIITTYTSNALKRCSIGFIFIYYFIYRKTRQNDLRALKLSALHKIHKISRIRKNSDQKPKKNIKINTRK